MIWVLLAVVVVAGFAWYAWKDQDPPFGDDSGFPTAAPPQMDRPDKPEPILPKLIKKIIPRSHHKKKGS